MNKQIDIKTLFTNILEKNNFLFLFFLLIVTFFIFFDTLNYDFIQNWDDNINITENTYIKDFSTQGIATLFSKNTPIAEPRLTLFTYMVQYHFWKLNPLPYHLFNLVLHLLNVILVFLLISKLFKKKDMALIAAALFAVHPMHVESVAWVTGRKDLLYTVFLILALLSYIKYLTEKKYSLKIILLFLICITSYLSLLSKIQAITLPILLFLIDFFYNRKVSIGMVYEKLFLSLLLLQILSMKITIIFGITLVFLLPFNNTETYIFQLLKKISNKLKTTIAIIILIAAIIFLLNNSIFITSLYCLILSAFCVERFKLYERVNIRSYIKYLLSGLAIISIIVIFIFYSKELYLKSESANIFTAFDRIFMASYSFCFYIIKFIAPFDLIAIIPYPSKGTEFLPPIYYASVALTIGLIVNLIWLINKYREYRRIIVFCILFFLINISLFLHLIPIAGRVIVADRYTYLAYLGLFILISFWISDLLLKKPKLSKLIISSFLLLFCIYSVTTWNRNKVWKNGFTLYSDIIEKNPDFAMAYTNRGYLYYINGDMQHAFSDYNKAINVNSSFTLSYYNRALSFIKIDNLNAALIDCNTALDINNKDKDILYLRGYIKNKLFLFNEAIEDFNNSLQIKPDNFYALYNRGEAKKNIKDFIGAILDYNKAIQLKPMFADTYNSRGVVNFQLEKYSESLKDYKKAIYLNPNLNYIYYNKALCEIKLLNNKEACKDLIQASKLGHTESKKLFETTCK